MGMAQNLRHLSIWVPDFYWYPCVGVYIYIYTFIYTGKFDHDLTDRKVESNQNSDALIVIM